MTHQIAISMSLYKPTNMYGISTKKQTISKAQSEICYFLASSLLPATSNHFPYMIWPKFHLKPLSIKWKCKHIGN